ncbi:MAG: hypothetical protein QM703_19245 [Gemmatales bacterium]
MSIKKRLDRLEKFFDIHEDNCLDCGREKGALPLAFWPYEGDLPKSAIGTICTTCGAYPEDCYYDIHNRGKLEQELRIHLGITPSDEAEFRKHYRFLFFDEIEKAEREQQLTLAAEEDDVVFPIDFPSATEIVAGSL